MAIQTEQVTMTTETGGAQTTQTVETITGRLLSISYLKDGTDPFADGVVFLITGDKTGQILWSETGVNASETLYPRIGADSILGAALLYAGSGEIVPVPLSIPGERINIVITTAGDAKVGQLRFVWEE